MTAATLGTTAGRLSRRLLAFAAITAGVQALAHAALFIGKRYTADSPEGPVIAAMKSRSFDLGVLGARSFWDMYFGYGLVAATFAAFVAAIVAVAANTTDQATRRRLIITTTAAILVHAVLVAMFFFLLPLLFDLALLVLLVGALGI